MRGLVISWELGICLTGSGDDKSYARQREERRAGLSRSDLEGGLVEEEAGAGSSALLSRVCLTRRNSCRGRGGGWTKHYRGETAERG